MNVELATIGQNNPQLRIHEHGGFSLGDYHEFFLDYIPAHRAYRFGPIETSFGQGSPLLAKLFWGMYYEKYHGEWSAQPNLRITNCPLDVVEKYVIAALLAYQGETNYLPGIQQILMDELFEEEFDAEFQGRGVVKAPPPIADLVPLRFYMAGLYSNHEAASLSFYRVLEYYASALQASKVTALRRDGAVSDVEFTRRTLELASRDERGPVFMLLNEITTPDIRKAAVKVGVIKEPQQGQLNEALYAYRNSIVHGKFGSAFTLRSPSVITPDGVAGAWRSLLQDLAWAALLNLGATV